MTELVGLVGCSKSKRGEDEPEREFPARDLYDSWLFDGRVEAVTAHCDEWAIFSAEHGYVEPDDQLTWYDTRITDLDPEERRELAEDVVHELPETDRLMILMGRDYADPLKAALPKGVDVWDPLEGVVLFDQRGALRDLATASEQTKFVTDGGTPSGGTYQNPYEEKIAGKTEIDWQCAVAANDEFDEEDPEYCGHDPETAGLVAPAHVKGDQVYLPGFDAHCPGCGQAVEFQVNGLGVFFG